MRFHGLSAFPITPASPDGVVDTDALGRLLTRLEAGGVDSVGLLGSTGTYMYLSRDQRRRALAAAREVLGGRLPILVGAGALRTDDACALARDAHTAGADALLLAPVSYTVLTADEVFHHFEAVAAASPLPLCIYDNPAATHFNFTHDLLHRLGTLPNVHALKTSAANLAQSPQLDALRANFPKDFSVGVAFDRHVPQALTHGADAWYSVMAGLFPRETRTLMHAAQRRDSAEVERLSAAFTPLWDLFDAHSGLRTMYAVASVLGLGDYPLPRPLLPLPSSERPRVEAAVARIADLA